MEVTVVKILSDESKEDNPLRCKLTMTQPNALVRLKGGYKVQP